MMFLDSLVFVLRLVLIFTGDNIFMGMVCVLFMLILKICLYSHGTPSLTIITFYWFSHQEDFQRSVSPIFVKIIV